MTPSNETLQMLRDNAVWGNICFDRNLPALGKKQKRVAGLQAGIKEGPYKTSIKDIVVMVPCRANDAVTSMFYAWGKKFNDAGSLEFFAFNESKPAAPLGQSVERPAITTKLVAATKTDSGYGGGRKAMFARAPMLMYSGKEGGIKESLSQKVKKHIAYVSDDVANNGKRGRYAEKKWFIKSDTDTFVITQHLLAVLSNYNPKKPWYIGYHFEKGDHRYISGGLYALSREAMRRLGPRMGGASVLRFEDVMVGAELQRAGVAPTKHKGFHWKRPYQREIEWGVVGGLVQVHKIKDYSTMNDLLSWTKYVLGGGKAHQMNE